MKAYRFRLPIEPPLRMRGEVHSSRDGILLEQDGVWAEASPLPGFSRESIDDVVEALQGNGDDVASLEFARSSLARPWTSCRVPLCALLQGESDRVLDKCQQLAKSAWMGAKLKVGRSSLSSDIQLVREVRARLRSDQVLRLDANRAWSLDDAKSFALTIGDCAVQYIEEPLQDALCLEEFYHAYPMRYALDESLLEDIQLNDFPNAAALVCKPTLLGDRLHPFIESGFPIVFSAAFESGVGIARIAQLAATVSPDTLAGLDTYSWLGEDVLIRGVSFMDGEVHVTNDPALDMDLLEEIDL